MSAHPNYKLLTLFSVVFSLFACQSDSSRAAIQSFFDRASFEAAIQGSTLFEFEGLAVPGPGNPSVNLGDSASFGDATIVSTTSGSGVWAVATGSFGAPTGQIASLNSGSLRIDLAPGYKAIGMDIGEVLTTAFSTSFAFDLMGTSGSLLSGNINVRQNDVLGQVLGDPTNESFFGYVSDTEEISSLLLTGLGASQFETIDNLIYGNPIPEPTSLTCFAGLSILGLFRYDRLRKRAC